MFDAVLTFRLLSVVVFVAGPGLLTERLSAADETASAPSDEKRPCGVIVHTVESEFQAGPTEIRVLPPTASKQGKKHRTLYVLPVEAGNGKRWGDSIQEVVRHDIHNRHDLVCVFPTFSRLPWYADHPTELAIRQESHFLKTVVPFVERAYPVESVREARLLVGFSKSGWGAWSLLLRHPKQFGKAAAWDAPLMTDKPNKYGMGPIFATQENFERYQISALLKNRADPLGRSPRLILMGHDAFKAQHEAVHRLMDTLKLRHHYREGPHRDHSWNSGWLPEAVELLVSDSGDGK